MTDRSIIPIGIVGLNYGRWIIEDLLDEKAAGHYFRLAAVSDLDSSRAQAMADRTGARKMTFEQILTDPGIPSIGLFTGPSGRAGMIRRIIRAGKDVMTTKPFELDVSEAISVLEEARALGRIVHLNSPAPVLPPDLARIEQWHDEYALGHPIACRADTYASYHEQADGTWYDDARRCPVSPVFRIGIYLINDLVRLFGEPDAVQVLSSRIRTGRPTPDNAQLGIRFKNGALANVFASLCIDDGQRWTNSLTLNYENGTIYRNIGPLAFDGGPEETTTLRLLARPEGTPHTKK
jgi:predicted dehydrogenase